MALEVGGPKDGYKDLEINTGASSSGPVFCEPLVFPPLPGHRLTHPADPPGGLGDVREGVGKKRVERQTTELA